MYCHVVYVSPGRATPARVRRSAGFSLFFLEFDSFIAAQVARAKTKHGLDHSAGNPLSDAGSSSGALSVLCVCLPAERAPKGQTEARNEKERKKR